MTYETLKRSHVKRNILIAVVIVFILSAIILTFTRAKYRTTESMPLLNGTINYTLADLNIVVMYLDGSEIDTLPDGNYELTEESYCTNEENVKDEAITLSYDSSTKGLSVSPMTKKGTKCYLYFEEGASAGDTILAQEGGADAIKTKGTPDFSKTAQTDEGMYATEDDWGTSYYYRGAVNDSWFQFGTNSSGQPLYWRIIRVNGDGTVRLIYNGASTQSISSSTQIESREFNNTTAANNMYVGYMYTDGYVHGLQNNSTIKNSVDNWYRYNLSEYDTYLNGNTGFCGDREPSSSSNEIDGQGGTGTTQTYYAAYIRLQANKSPDLHCLNDDDLYTTVGSSSGNKALTYPVGLITADEMAMAGAVIGYMNVDYYLYTGKSYWSMTPYSYSSAGIFKIEGDSNYYRGGLSYSYVYGTGGVRPVINLRSDVSIIGSGSTSDPFKIQ